MVRGRADGKFGNSLRSHSASRPGNAGAITAADHTAVLDLALGRIPAQYIEQIEIRVRADCSRRMSTARLPAGALSSCTA